MLASVLVFWTAALFQGGDAVPLAKAQQVSALAATARVRSPGAQTWGSAALIGRSGAYLYALTANHVVEPDEGLELRTHAAGTPPRPAELYRSVQVLDRMPREDLALIRVTAMKPTPHIFKICPTAAAPRDKDFAAFAAGCGAEAPELVTGRVSGRKLVQRLGADGTASFWEFDQPGSPGRSGGALLDERGLLVGISSFTGNGKTYACHLDAIHALLRRNGLTHLAE